MDELKLDELRNKCLTSLYNCVENIAKYVGTEENRNVEFNELRSYVKGYCKMELQEEAGKKAIGSFEKETDLPNWDELKNAYEKQLSKYYKKSANFDKHPYAKDLEKHIKTAERSIAVSEQDSEQDLAITETNTAHIDPISKRPICNPMRNTICRHVYEKDTIESIIRNKKNKGCPYMGCPNKQVMLEQHLEVDEELQLTIRRTQPSQASQEF